MFLIVLIALTLIAYYYLSITFQYWKKAKVPHPDPSFFFGNIGASLTLKRSLGQIYTEIYNAFPDCTYVGYYKIRKPGIILRDPELIRNVLGKDFNSFHDNDFEVDEDADPIFARNTFVLNGSRWRAVKNLITPCFTPNKLKCMFPLVENAAKQLVNYLEKESELAAPHGLETRELFAKYGTEVVASCAFGMNAKVFTEEDSLFRKMGRKIYEPTFKTVLNHYIMLLAPSLTRFLKVGFLSESLCKYYLDLITGIVEYREKNNVVRNDFLDVMIDLKRKSQEFEFTNLDITAQAVAFLTDGFETSSAVMSYTFHELAGNPDVLKQLRQEIDQAFAEKHGVFDFDSIMDLQYLDAVLNESLRMHPPGIFLVRMCTKRFAFPSPRGHSPGTEVAVEVGTPIVIPVYGLHYDPKYFKDPYMFKPERFLPQNKDFIIKGTFLPFGEGPRACHGKRFGLMQIKTVIVHVLRNFDIEVGEKTVLPLEIDPRYMVPHAKGGLWLNFSKRRDL